jgi:TRAP-type mannitol/chloroaromatic compound transport system substrate-binding protein
MAGWFRKEMGGASDLAGMKVRIGGFAGKVLETLETRGAIAVSLPKEKILDVLANGSLDAFEWIAPYDDEKFAVSGDGVGAPISTVAPFLLSPRMVEDRVRAHYDAANPAASRRLVVGGAQLRLFAQDVLESLLPGDKRSLRAARPAKRKVQTM